MNSILSIVEWYTEHFATNVPDFAQYDFVYGWLAAMSGVVAILTLVFVIFKREAGATSATMIGQHLLVLGVPFMIGSISGLYGEGAAEGASLFGQQVIASAAWLVTLL